MNARFFGRAAALAAGISIVGAAHASSPAAWDAFRADIRAKCVAAGKRHLLTQVKAEVDPFGSESYGLAIVSGLDANSPTRSRFLCVVGKRSGKAELGGELQYYVK